MSSGSHCHWSAIFRKRSGLDSSKQYSFFAPKTCNHYISKKWTVHLLLADWPVYVWRFDFIQFDVIAKHPISTKSLYLAILLCILTKSPITMGHTAPGFIKRALLTRRISEMQIRAGPGTIPIRSSRHLRLQILSWDHCSPSFVRNQMKTHLYL